MYLKNTNTDILRANVNNSQPHFSRGLAYIIYNEHIDTNPNPVLI